MKYSKEITEILVTYLREHHELNTNDLLLLAEKCRLTPLQVKSWFRNKRNREIRKAKRLQQSEVEGFDTRVRRCKTLIKKLYRWVETAKRYINWDSSDTSSDSSWEHTRSEDEEEDDVDPLTLAAEAANASLLGSAAELERIIQGYKKDGKKKDVLLGEGQSISAKALHGNQLSGQEVFSFLDDDKPSTSKAAAAAAKALHGDNQLLDNKESGYFGQGVPPNLLLYLDNIPSTSKAAAALYGDSIFEKKSSLAQGIPPIIVDYRQTTLEATSNNDGIQFLENLTSNSFGKVEPTLVTERKVEEFPFNDDQPSTSKAAAVRLLYHRQQFLENKTTNLVGPLMSKEEALANELPDSAQGILPIIDDDTPTTSRGAKLRYFLNKQGVKKEAQKQESDSSVLKQPSETETPEVPIKEEENNENRLYGNCIFVPSIISTEQINIPIVGPEDELSISSAAAAVEEITEVDYLYNQQYLVPVTLADFDDENIESTSEPKVVYLVGYGNFSPEV